jgi:ubiquitin C-terminal hydrolase
MASFINTHVTKKGATATATASASSPAIKATAMKISFASAGTMTRGGSAGMGMGMVLIATSPSTLSPPSPQHQQRNQRPPQSSPSAMTTTVLPSTTSWSATRSSPATATATFSLGQGQRQQNSPSRATKTTAVISPRPSTKGANTAMVELRHSPQRRQKKQNEALQEFARTYPTLTARAMVLSTPYNHAAGSSVAAIAADAACYASVLCATRPREVSQLLQRQFSSAYGSKTKQHQRTFLTGSNTQSAAAVATNLQSFMASLPTRQQAFTLGQPQRVEYSVLHRHRMQLLSRTISSSLSATATVSSSITRTQEYDARGLRNPSQMCFVNSILQALTSLPSVVSFLQSSVWMMAATEVQTMQSQVLLAEQEQHQPTQEVSDVLLELLLDLGGVGFYQSLKVANEKNETDNKSHNGISKTAASEAGGGRIHIASSPLNRPANRDILQSISQQHVQFRNVHAQATVGHEQQDAQEFFQALMDHLMNEAQTCHFMEVDAGCRVPDASVVLQSEDEEKPRQENVALPTLLNGMHLQSTAEDKAKMIEMQFENEDAFLAAQSRSPSPPPSSASNQPPPSAIYGSDDLVCDTYSDSGAEEKKSHDDYGLKYRQGRGSSLSPDKHVSFQDVHDGLPMTHVTTSASTDTTSNSTTTSSSDLQSVEIVQPLSMVQEAMLDDESSTDGVASSLLFNDQAKLLSTLHSTAPSPLSGWLGSCLQCCTCHYVRPIHNAPFVDVPIVPTAVTNMLDRRGGNGQNSPRANTGSPSTVLPCCSLQECLSDFTSMERVTEVECRNCALIQAKEKIQDEISLLEHGVQSMKKKSLDSSPLRGELAMYKTRQKELDQMDPDDDFHWEKEQGHLGGRNESLDTYEDLMACENSNNLLTGKLIPLKKDFWKCLLITRLPNVICLHIQRRYYNASQDRMAKAIQHVAFDETLDMAPYCVYAGERFGNASKDSHSERFSPEKPGSVKHQSVPYRLMSVVEHRGNAHMGHYVAYRRLVKEGNASSGARRTDQWVRISDEMVNVVQWKEVQRCQAYMLFYEAA